MLSKGGTFNVRYSIFTHKNAFSKEKMIFFTKIFAYIKKMLYLCTLFRLTHTYVRTYVRASEARNYKEKSRKGLTNKH